MFPKISAKKKHLILQVGLGILILFLLSSLIIIPLLSSADATFSGIFSGILEVVARFFAHIRDFIFSLFKSFSFFRLLLTIFGTMIVLGYAIYWGRDLSGYYQKERRSYSIQKYSVTLGIVLTGVLILYLIFIGIQIKTLFVGALPTEFASTEKLVKTGFWQLFLLTIINVLFYIGIYNKSTDVIQKILCGFTFASMLLIVSAAHKMYLYVTYYGLSYEKFYAFYTVVFCIGVFIWFLSLFFRDNKKAAIVQTLAFVSLWMYSLTAIIPLETIIFSTNLTLTQNPESRIDINELDILGFDALPYAAAHAEEVLELGFIDHSTSNNAKYFYNAEKQWGNWYDRRAKKAKDFIMWFERWDVEGDMPTIPKKWYERTFIEIVYHPENPFREAKIQ